MNELDGLLNDWAQRHALPQERALEIRAIPRTELPTAWWKDHFRRMGQVLRASADPRNLRPA